MKYFVNINLGINADAKKTSNVSGKSSLSLKQWAQQFPQFERWYIAAINATGTYDLTNKDGSHNMKGVANISPKTPLAEVGNVVNVGFYDCDRRKPYIWSPGISQLEGEAAPPPLDYFLPWNFHTRRYSGRFFMGELDIPIPEGSGSGSGDPLGSGDEYPTTVVGSIISEHTPGIMVRADSEGNIAYASGNTIYSKNLTTNDVTSYVFDDDIVMLSICEVTGRIYAWTGYFEAVVIGDPCQELYDFGVAYFEDTSFGSPYFYAYNMGYDNCLNEDGYHPDTGGDDFIALYDPPMPEGYDPEDAENIECWHSGIRAGFTPAYNNGYEGGGCTLP